MNGIVCLSWIFIKNRLLLVPSTIILEANEINMSDLIKHLEDCIVLDWMPSIHSDGISGQT